MFTLREFLLLSPSQRLSHSRKNEDPKDGGASAPTNAYPAPPMYTRPLLGLVVAIALLAIAWQFFAFAQSKHRAQTELNSINTDSKSKIATDAEQSVSLPKGVESAETAVARAETNRHAQDERTFWIVTNIELFAPAAVTAILAWLTYSLIRYTVSALNLAEKQSIREEQRSLKDEEPYLDLDVFSVKIAPTLRGRYISANDPRFDRLWVYHDQYSLRNETPNDGEPSAFAAMSLEGAYPVVIQAELTCTLRNIGRGAAHSIEVSLKGFEWRQRSYLDYDNQVEEPYRVLYPTDDQDSDAAAYLSLERSVELLPRSGRQDISALISCCPTSWELAQSVFSVPQIGVYVQIRYKAFGDSVERVCETAIFTQQQLFGPGRPSSFEVTQVETLLSFNPTLGMNKKPCVKSTSVPHFDGGGDRLISWATGVSIDNYIRKQSYKWLQRSSRLNCSKDELKEIVDGLRDDIDPTLLDIVAKFLFNDSDFEAWFQEQIRIKANSRIAVLLGAEAKTTSDRVNDEVM